MPAYTERHHSLTPIARIGLGECLCTTTSPSGKELRESYADREASFADLVNRHETIRIPVLDEDLDGSHMERWLCSQIPSLRGGYAI